MDTGQKHNVLFKRDHQQFSYKQWHEPLNFRMLNYLSWLKNLEILKDCIKIDERKKNQGLFSFNFDLPTSKIRGKSQKKMYGQ